MDSSATSLLVPSTPQPSRSPLSIRSTNVPSGRFHLTPVAKSKPLPRAWERKPATPFAPRTESHKIWKRYRVGSLNAHSDPDSSSLATGAFGIGKENVHALRAVKKLRVDREGTTVKTLEETHLTRRKRGRQRSSHETAAPDQVLPTQHDLESNDAAEVPDGVIPDAEGPQRDIDIVPESETETGVESGTDTRSTSLSNEKVLSEAEVEVNELSINGERDSEVVSTETLPADRTISVIDESEYMKATDLPNEPSSASTKPENFEESLEFSDGIPKEISEDAPLESNNGRDELADPSPGTRAASAIDKANSREPTLVEQDSVLYGEEDGSENDHDESINPAREIAEQPDLCPSGDPCVAEATISSSTRDLDSTQLYELLREPTLSCVESDSPGTTAEDNAKSQEHNIANLLQAESGEIPTDEEGQSTPLDVCAASKDAGENPPRPSFLGHLKTPNVEDAELLQNFLSRAQAKKAAKKASSPSRSRGPIKELEPCSPMTRSRSALVTFDHNSSPQKVQGASSPSPKPSRAGEEEGEDTTAETGATSPCRRSRRTAVPKPQRLVPAMPSTIPLRRAEGTEFIFLQRTEAQELALATRSNTTRNKGQAVLPKFFLQNLATQTDQAEPSPPGSGRRTGMKQVSWDEQLAYFQDHKQDKKPEEEAKELPSTRRARRTAPGNGTPAPKRAMRAAATGPGCGTPFRKRRGRARVK